ncbi:MAG: ThiF family adenylyltransferase, partial [Bdellovibrionales bacterium]
MEKESITKPIINTPSEDFLARFGGLARLYGLESLKLFSQSKIAIIGIGGVGSWAAEALARSGIGEIHLIDMDELCITNTNRQIHATQQELYKPKVDALERRLLSINPEIKVVKKLDFFTEETAMEILSPSFDFVIDAIDSLRNKSLLASLCKQKSIELVVCGGAGGLQDPTQIKISDLSKSYNDGLLHQMRKRLRQKLGFPRGRKNFGIQCVFSSEDVHTIGEDGCPTQSKENLPGG